MSFEQYRPAGFRMLPPVVKNLLIINGIFFLATLGLGQAFNIDLYDKLGLHYFASEKFAPYQFITYMFMHGNFMHLFFNMFALWMFGYVLENVWGPKKFLIYYLITGLGAAVTHYIIVYIELRPVIEALQFYINSPGHIQLNNLLNSGYIDGSYEPLSQFISKYNLLIQTDMPKAVSYSAEFISQYKADVLNGPLVVGASGAVFGILLAFGMMFPNTMLYVYFAIPIKAKWFVIIYGALELISGISNVKGDNVAHFAHLGGMLFGLIMILIWRRQNKKRTFHEQ
jgi:membrane associated rhomboid family serine protease